MDFLLFVVSVIVVLRAWNSTGIQFHFRLCQPLCNNITFMTNLLIFELRLKCRFEQVKSKTKTSSQLQSHENAFLSKMYPEKLSVYLCALKIYK